MIRINELSDFESASAGERLCRMAFALALCNQADQIVFDYYPERYGVWIRYWSEGTLHELGGMPEPAAIWPELMRDLLGDVVVTSTGVPDHPAVGTVPVLIGGVLRHFDLLCYRGQIGEHVWVELKCPPDVSEAAEHFLRQISAHRAGRGVRLDFPLPSPNP
ncbi:MAG TPA: hypothetical protein VKE40_02565 [Gemmataceae bacterium]|nr:hypothetical protein [Gemmataceae bacterium]